MLKLRFLFLVTVLVCVQVRAQQGNAQSEALPLLVHADLPLYPVVAHTARITGKVEAQVTVKGGVVTDVKLEPGSHPLLATAATENIKTWRFWPDSNAIFSTVFIYSIEGDEVLETQNPTIDLHLPKLVKITSMPTRPPTTP